MASGKTENYGLSQWEATDQVVRADFNADNEKIDAGIKEAQELAATAKSMAETHASIAWSDENSPFVIGAYVGDGTSQQIIELGFKPKIVWIQRLYFGPSGGDCALVIQNQPYKHNNTILVEITDTGFTVGFLSYSSGSVGCPNMNFEKNTYVYVALK